MLKRNCQIGVEPTCPSSMGGRGEVPHCPVAGNAGEYDVLCVLQVIYKSSIQAINVKSL